MADTVVYTIDNTDGTLSFVIQPKIIDGPGFLQQHTDLYLCGNTAQYWGEKFNENFVRLLENFATIEDPAVSPPQPQTSIQLDGIDKGVNRPIPGQLWFNKSRNILYVRATNNSWKPVNLPIVGSTTPGNDATGALWYDTSAGVYQLKVFNGSSWVSSSNNYVRKSGDTMTGALILTPGASPTPTIDFVPSSSYGRIRGINQANKIRSEIVVDPANGQMSLKVYDANETIANYLQLNEADGVVNKKLLYSPGVAINDNLQLVTKQYVDSVAGTIVGVVADGINLSSPGSNIGNVFFDDNTTVLKFKPITGSSHITVTETTSEVNLAIASGSGLVTNGANVGTGAGTVFKNVSGSTLNFRNLLAGNNITITNVGDDVQISSAPGAGVITTGTSLGGGSAVYKGVVGTSLQFRSIKSGVGVAVTTGTDDITISSSSASLGVNQTWQAFSIPTEDQQVAGETGSAERVGNTWYQNTTGKPIWVSVQCVSGASGRGCKAWVHVSEIFTSGEGLIVDHFGNGAGLSTSTLQTIVPSGHWYKVRPERLDDAFATIIERWNELR